MKIKATSIKNTMVLEISVTPYIFTFKLWDWGRIEFQACPQHILTAPFNLAGADGTPYGFFMRRLSQYCLAPVDPSVPDEEVTFASLLTPDRRHKRDRAVCMLLYAPAGADLLEQVQLDLFTASTRTEHCRCPKVLWLASEINSEWLKRVGKFVNLAGAIERRLFIEKS